MQSASADYPAVVRYTDRYRGLVHHNAPLSAVAVLAGISLVTRVPWLAIVSPYFAK